MGFSFNFEEVLKMIESPNKQLSAQIERRCERAPQLQYINQPSASLQVD